MWQGEAGMSCVGYTRRAVAFNMQWCVSFNLDTFHNLPTDTGQHAWAHL